MKKFILKKIENFIFFPNNKYYFENVYCSNFIETYEFLENCCFQLKDILKKNKTIDEKNNYFMLYGIEKIISKYEIFGRIFDFYSINFNKIGNNFSNIKIYILFFYLLTLMCEIKKDPYYLNCLLKLKDLINEILIKEKIIFFYKILILISLSKINKFLKDLEYD